MNRFKKCIAVSGVVNIHIVRYTHHEKKKVPSNLSSNAYFFLSQATKQ